MPTSRREVYVEIPTRKRPHSRQSAPSSDSATVGCARPSSPPSSPSPRKKRKTTSSYAPSSHLSNDVRPSTSASRVENVQTSGQSWSDDIITTFDYDFEKEDDIYESYHTVYGESIPDEDSSENDLPIRLLNNFIIYDNNSKVVLLQEVFSRLPTASTVYRASGSIRPFVEDIMDESGSDRSEESSDDSEENYSLIVTLSWIVEFYVHGKSDGVIDGKIWIRTQHAWYILCQPADIYHTYFVNFWVQHRVLHLLLVKAEEDQSLTWSSFRKCIGDFDKEEEAIVSSIQLLGRWLEKADVEDMCTRAYLLNLKDIVQKNSIKIQRVPIFRELTGIASADHKVAPPQWPKKSVKHNSKTFLTTAVNQIANNLFTHHFEVDKSSEDGNVNWEKSDLIRKKFQAHPDNPSTIKLFQPFPKDSLKYRCASVDGQKYTVGDIVIVVPDEEYLKKNHCKAAQTANKYGKSFWFSQIRYFESKGGKNQFHGQWFEHGSRTILQETAHSTSLYYLGTCNDNPIASIYQKCNLEILPPREREDDHSPDNATFHVTHMYVPEAGQFKDLPAGALDFFPGAQKPSCFACELSADEESQEGVHTFYSGKRDDSDLTAVAVHGIMYHKHEFIYIRPPDRVDGLLDVAQVLEILPDLEEDETQVQIRYFGRYEEDNNTAQEAETGETLLFDERRLFLKNVPTHVPASWIDGKCFIKRLKEERDIEKWVERDDHFFFHQQETEASSKLERFAKSDFQCCEACFKAEEAEAQKDKQYQASKPKLVGMELFSGAGGLGIGMELSGFVDVKHAVEFWDSAAKTYQRNHPDTTVYCQDSNQLLKRAVEKVNGENPPPLTMNGSKRVKCPDLPNPNIETVDFIFGGPPCQSFSRANHFKDPNDIRTTMPLNQLSYVEFYRPTYFLLENVAGFLYHKIPVPTTNDGETHIIENGMVKVVLRILIALGYQVQFRLLQAGRQGVPQSRPRVIFWGAKRGVTLPDFPVPMYAVALRGNAGGCKLLDGDLTLLPPTRSRSRKKENHHYCAPLKMLTVRNATNDLTRFDWINPHAIIKQTPADKKTARNRNVKLDIWQFEAATTSRNSNLVKDLPGFPEGVGYILPPQNRYQKWLRRNMEVDEVTAHYTGWWSAKTVEATCTVPLRPLADHRDLPKPLLNQRMIVATKNKVFYGRMDGNGQFKCATTTLSPVSKSQWPLHPEDKRIVSVREAARAQGFPDDYEFESVRTEATKVVQDQLKQIGNAVAVPFALSLGKELGKALIKDWDDQGRMSPEL